MSHVDTRISDVAALLGPHNALGGWAALYVQGNGWFDGAGRDVDLRDVMVHCSPGSQLRRRTGVEPTRSDLFVDELIQLENYAVATPARAAYDEMRLARSLREAVVVLDMATSTTSNVCPTTVERIERVIHSHHKTRGIVQARRALDLGSSRSASPWETRTRLAAEHDAGIRGLSVNVPVFDHDDHLLGVADLLDEKNGLIIESDGAHHRALERHTDDNRREEEFERAGCVVARVTALDHRDRYALAARLRKAHAHARRLPDPTWTLEPPSWWLSWPAAHRWQ